MFSKLFVAQPVMLSRTTANISRATDILSVFIVIDSHRMLMTSPLTQMVTTMPDARCFAYFFLREKIPNNLPAKSSDSPKVFFSTEYKCTACLSTQIRAARTLLSPGRAL